MLRLAGVGAARVSAAGENPVTLVVDVVPAPWAVTGYDLRYDKVDGLTAIVDGELIDLGDLATLGGRYRFAADVREIRGSLSSPWARGLTTSVFRIDEDLGADLGLTRTQHGRRDPAGPASARSLGPAPRLSPQAGDHHLVHPGAPGRARALAPARDARQPARRDAWPLPEPEPRALAPRLAADQSFVKGFAQASIARSFGSHVVWAQGVRLGLAHVFDDNPLLATERFLAGGATSVRGFTTNAVGPLDVLGEPAGGQAVFVFNQELRVRHRNGLGAAVFYDLGNVFERVRDVRLSARHSVGLGLRWASPIGLLRLDFAVPVGRQPGEARWQRVIALGQAF